VLGIVCRTISDHVLKKDRLTRTSGATGAVTLIQRFEQCARCGGCLGFEGRVAPVVCTM
jgi:hypothetical protein